ncbi:DUF262 domain-containing protein [Chryseobacterium sp. RR2-3-20]|uniref:GmrSD restriction endonuclease domain-containing protein n=1 Tax=Chryseobacterium sp. RR2-3-20 TaxID=2787626 RepID=UPI001AE08AD4|nr:DUF262 domain-containing protein [Chryseobacterium sp. RR2-3-20]
MAKPILDIVTKPYIIPIYQRNYNWGFDEITQLLQDIYESYHKDKTQDYFLGSLIVFKRQSASIYEVIDGQQRLTTLHIILSLLWKEINRIYPLAYDSRPEVVSFFTNLRRQQIAFKASNQEISEANLINFLKAINTILNTKLESDIESTLAIHNLIENDEIDSFIDYILQKVILVEVVMPEDTDVASYFEIMNNRGKQLEEHEIIKAQLMTKIKNAKQRHLFGKVWDACSEMNRPVQKFFTPDERLILFGEEYDAVFPKKIMQLNYHTDNVVASSILDILKNPNQKLRSDALLEHEDELDEDVTYTSIIDFSNFLIHVLKLVYAQVDIPLSSDQLLKIFKDIPNNVLETVTPLEFVQQLLFYRVVFDRFIVKSTAGLENNDAWDEEANGARWILKKPVMRWQNRQKYAKYYRTLKFVNSFTETKDNLSYQERIVKLLSMLQVTYRQRKNKNYLQYILSLFDPSTPSSLNISSAEYIKKIEAFALQQFEKLDIVDFLSSDLESDFTQENVYWNGTDTPHFIFNFIDYLLWVNQVWNEVDYGILPNFDFTYRNSVEHHFPQAQQDLLTTTDIDKNVILHCLGNLCLISKGANSKLNDRSAWDKATDPRYSNGTLTPKRKIMYSITQENKWNIKQIIEHYYEIVKVLSERNEILSINC